MTIITKPIPTDNPKGTIILYENLLTTTAGSATAMLTPNTYERFVDTIGGITATFQLTAATEINSIGIAAHNLGSTNTEIIVSVAPTIAGTFVEVGSISPKDDSAILFTFDNILAADVKLVVNAPIDIRKEIGVIFAGKSLQIERNIYGGHSPLSLSQKTTYRSPRTETGQIIARDIIRKGLAGSFSWQFLDPDWYRENFQPFVESARLKPFFIKWRPDFYSDEVAYAETTDDITPVNMGGGHRLMSVSINVRAHADL